VIVAVALTDGESKVVDALQAIDRRPARRAARVFSERGFPHRRMEAWKYSDLRSALSSGPTLSVAPGDALHVRQYQPVQDDGDPIEMLAGALAGELDFITEEGGLQTFDGFGVRAWKVFGKAILIERLGEARGLAASSFRAIVNDGAELIRVVIHSGAGDDLALSTANVEVGQGAKFRQMIVSTGARLARIETHVSVQGEGSEVELNGAYMTGPGRHADLTSVITHKVGGARTRQLIKGVAAKGGRGVFQGKIVVERGAQQTDARQYHHGMLLEAGAEIFAKPELMIHADDVQCAHGNTAGGLDQTALFYMRSRGIGEAEARALLIEAFLVEAIPEGLPAELVEGLTGMMRDWLAESAA
jgi:Fe-S cluster assembly protein SufD